MDKQFKYFVVLAGMRTGSNLLEESLAAMPGIESWGELFNPHFMGKPESESAFGIAIDQRDRDPISVINAMVAESQGLPGFRLFNEHDQRVMDHVLNDPMAAKVVLSRRPIDSYVSLKIAQQTGQWWLSDVSSRRSAKAVFDTEEYVEFLEQTQKFQREVHTTIQTTGQAAFFLSYEDLSDQHVLAGLSRFIGADGPPDESKIRAIVQNPTPVSAKVTNPEEAEEALKSIAMVDAGRVPIFEPDRGPGMRLFRTCASLPLVYMPIRGAGFDPVPNWMKNLDPNKGLRSGMTQKELRKWKRQHPGHRSFTILRHPLPRAYDAFNRYIVPQNQDAYGDIRAALTSRYSVSLPEDIDDPNWSMEKHAKAFLGFLDFLTVNLSGQTSLRVDNTWASQATLLGAIAQFSVPDKVMREERLEADLQHLADEIGIKAEVGALDFTTPAKFALKDLVNEEINTACETAYRRDYLMYGMRRWTKT